MKLGTTPASLSGFVASSPPHPVSCLDGEGQGSLACRSPWALKESDTTELLMTTTTKGWRTYLNSPVLPETPVC